MKKETNIAEVVLSSLPVKGDRAEIESTLLRVKPSGYYKRDIFHDIKLDGASLRIQLSPVWFVDFGMYVCSPESNGAQLMLESLRSTSSGKLPPDKSFSNRKFAQRIISYSTPSGGRTHVCDGRVWLNLYLKQYLPRQQRQPDEVRKFLIPPRNYLLLLEDLAERTLARLTVHGITSKPAESAPEWAKKETNERLLQLRRGQR